MRVLLTMRHTQLKEYYALALCSKPRHQNVKRILFTIAIHNNEYNIIIFSCLLVRENAVRMQDKIAKMNFRANILHRFIALQFNTNK